MHTERIAENKNCSSYLWTVSKLPFMPVFEEVDCGFFSIFFIQPLVERQIFFDVREQAVQVVGGVWDIRS